MGFTSAKINFWIFAYSVMKVTELIKEFVAIIGSWNATGNDLPKLRAKRDLNGSMEIIYLKNPVP